MLAGYTRMTYSLAVIVMETSQAINIFMPVLVTVAVANFTGQFFTRGLYDRAVRAKQMPILKKDVPAVNAQKRAEEIMNPKVISLRSVDTVKQIHQALKSPHHGFPVLNLNGQVIGLIPKNFLYVILEKRSFYAHASQKHFVVNGMLKQYLKQNLIINKEKSRLLDSS